MPAVPDDSDLTRRERQIMEVVYSKDRASARDILGAIPEPPGYSSVRKLLGILVKKGHLHQESEGKRLLYSATKPRGRAAKGAMQRLLDVFFAGSVEDAVSGMISLKRDELSEDQLARLASVVEDAQRTTTEQTKPTK